MLDKESPSARNMSAPDANDSVLAFDLNSVIEILLVHRVLIGMSTAIVAGLVFTYCMFAPLLGSAYYTAVAQVLLDQQRAQIFKPDVAVAGDITFDNASVESQVANIHSERVVSKVVRKLKLIDDPEFNGSSSLSPLALVKRLLSPFLQLFGLSTPPTEEQRIRSIVDVIIQKRLKAQRIGLSYAIEVSVDSWYADKAALLANSVVEAYIADQIAARAEATRVAGQLMQKQLEELRGKALEAEQRVLDFKLKNNLIDVGGTLVADQQLAEVSSQLSAAVADTAERDAKLKRFLALEKGDIPDSNLADALKNEVITRLREQYVDTSRKLSEWSRRYGPNHGAVVRLRDQMTEMRRSMSDELHRIGQGYRSDYEISLSRQKALEQRLDKIFKSTASLRDAQAKLRDLEAGAQSYRNLHDNMLNRFNGALQQEVALAPNARVIGKAAPPQARSSPKTLVFTVAAAFGGLLLGCGIALMRAFFDDTARKDSDLSRLLRVDHVGVLPLVLPKDRDLSRIPAARVAIPGGAESRTCRAGTPMLCYVVDLPASRFAETIRGLRLSFKFLNDERAAKILGVVSTVGGEGKGTVATNLARLSAQVGEKVLLVDADLRARTLSRELAPKAKRGLVEALADGDFAGSIFYDTISTMHFVPVAAVEARLSNTDELLGSQAMKRFLQAATQSYDYVIFDLPPVGPVVDVRAVAPSIDAFLYVVQWNGTPISAIKRALASAPEVADKIRAAVLNQADFDAMSREARMARYHANSGYYVE